MKKPRVFLGAALVLLLLASLPAEAATPENSRFQYSIKFVCGWVAPQPVGEEPPVKPGNYATAINIHNLSPALESASVRVTLHYAPGAPAPPVVSPQSFKVFRHRTLEVDCRSIWGMAQLPPGTFVKGMLHLGLRVRLPVVAVYTSQTVLDPQSPPDAGAGISLDVEHVEPFIEPPVMP